MSHSTPAAPPQRPAPRAIFTVIARPSLLVGALVPFALATAGAQTTGAPSTSPPTSTPLNTPAQTAASTQGPVLSLAEAIETARGNNPSYLVTENGRRRASASLLGANGALLPTVNVGLGSGYREGRPQNFAGQSIGNTAGTLASNWSADATLNYSLGIAANRRAARAAVTAADADVGSAAATLRANVTQQYINALQQDARVRLQDTLLLTSRAQLELARARAQVGAGTVLDVRRAEVTVGQTEATRLQATNQSEIERLRLYQLMGVEPRTDARLVTDFALTPVPLSLPELVSQAQQANPALGAYRARERQAHLDVRAAQSQYLPSLSLQATVGGYTQQSTDISQTIAQRQQNGAAAYAQCQNTAALYAKVGMPFDQNCTAFQFTDAQAAALRSGNRTYPFNFTRNPYNLSAFISLPLFNGFQREQRVQVASAGERDAEFRRREQELRLTADVTAAYRTILTDQRTAEIQQRNAQVAREALVLAEERYKVGASTFVDVLQARGDFERAQNDYITVVYQYQRDFATLENAVGRPLR